MTDFMYGPIEDGGRRYDLEPLEFDDEEDESELYDDSSYVDYEDEDDYEEPGLAGWDDLRPFGSFDDGFGWDDSF